MIKNNVVKINKVQCSDLYEVPPAGVKLKKFLCKWLCFVIVVEVLFLGYLLGLVSHTYSKSVYNKYEVSYEAGLSECYSNFGFLFRSPVQENYCLGFRGYAQEIVDEYKLMVGGSDVEVFLSSSGDYSLCVNDKAIACAYLGGDKIFIKVKPFPFFVGYLSDFSSLKHVLAHEYIHTLTTVEEKVWLEDNRLMLSGGVDMYSDVPAVEILADCGIGYFTGSDVSVPTGYLPSGCPSVLWIDAASSVIEDRLV